MPKYQPFQTLATHPDIHVGDTVTYRQEFLDRHDRYPNDLPAAKGTVKALHRLDNGTILADIDWNRPSLPKRVNVKNLAPKHATASGQ